MYWYPPPIEVIPGRSRAAYFSGFLLAVLAVALAWTGVEDSIAQSFGPIWSSKDNVAFSQLQLLGNLLVFGVFFSWFYLAPMPLPKVEVSPIGMTIKFGLDTTSFPWSRVFVVDSRLHTVGRWFGLVSRYSLTPYQESRIRPFLAPHP